MKMINMGALLGFLGIAVYFYCTVAVVPVGDAYLWLFVLNVPRLLSVSEISLSIAFLSFGPKETARALGTLGSLFIVRSPEKRALLKDAPIRQLIHCVYVAAALDIMVAWIVILFALEDPYDLGIAVSQSLMSGVYAVVFAECLLRPAMYRCQGRTP